MVKFHLKNVFSLKTESIKTPLIIFVRKMCIQYTRIILYVCRIRDMAAVYNYNNSRVTNIKEEVAKIPSKKLLPNQFAQYHISKLEWEPLYEGRNIFGLLL